MKWDDLKWILNISIKAGLLEDNRQSEDTPKISYKSYCDSSFRPILDSAFKKISAGYDDLCFLKGNKKSIMEIDRIRREKSDLTENEISLGILYLLRHGYANIRSKNNGSRSKAFG